MKQIKFLIPLIALCLFLGVTCAGVNDSPEYDKQLQGDGQDLPTGEEVLRCAASGQQSRPRCPQGAADSPDAR